MTKLKNERLIKAAVQDWENLEKIRSDQLCAAADETDNVAKNRYPNVKPFDKTRVILEGQENDYINASWVSGYGGSTPIERAYIATQAPLPTTCADFWLMIWQQNTRLIVMLTKLQESNKIKAHCYWPETSDEPTVFGNFEIKLIKEDSVARSREDDPGTAFIIREFQLKHKDHSTKRNIFQAHYCSWPDMAVPPSVEDILGMLKTVNTMMEKHDFGPPPRKLNCPMIVHCSAGLGRAGTFILIHTTLLYALEKGLSFEEIKIAEILAFLRTHREGLVQTKEQYLFAVKAIKSSLPTGSDSKGMEI